MDKVELKRGDLIDLNVRLSNSKFSNISYKSRVLEISDDNTMIITSPSDTNIKKWNGIEFKLSVVKNENKYTQLIFVIKQINDNGFFLLETKPFTPLEIEQRRRYVRVEKALNLYINGIGMLQTVNLSCCGVAFNYDGFIQDNEVLKGVLYLSEKVGVEFTGTVVRVEYLGRFSGQQQYLICLDLTEMHKRSRDVINKFINSSLMKKKSM